MRHEAIYALYNNVVTIDDGEGAFDKDGKAVSINESDVATKANELATANAYVGKRAAAYASIGDQLDMLFHDITNGKLGKTGSWYKAVKATKDKFTKP